MVLFHQVLGKCLRTLQNGRILPWSEHPESPGLKYIDNTAHQRVIHPHDGQINLLFLCKIRQFFKFHCSDGNAFRHLSNAGIARRAV